jgi:dipeptidyl aminopeptidase/acylaminoacyl peptidase
MAVNPCVLGVVGLALGAALVAPAQQPDTEVYLAPLSSRLMPAVYGPVVNISQNAGYDNQPSFTPDGSAILFTSNRDGRQTDVYRYDIDTGDLRQLTDTPESEYSPIVTPDGDGFSVIRVEADDRQRLWRFALDGTGPRLVLEDVEPVGYHAWIDARRVALFVLGATGQPNTLQIADTTTGTSEVITSRIGRSIHTRPGSSIVSFVRMPAEGPWLVEALDPASREVATIARTVDDNRSQDTAWDPATGRLLMARGSQVWAWERNGGWRLLGDLGPFGLRNITRIAVNPSGDADPMRRLAVVAEPAPR